jgi:hypothetical protein
MKGETKPIQEDPEYRPGDGKYSWFKAPRYEGEPCEVGPLARVLVAYGKGHKDIKPLVDSTLKKLDVPAAALFSTLGRTAARGMETIAIGDRWKPGSWVSSSANVKSGDTKTYEPWEMPDSGMGVRPQRRSPRVSGPLDRDRRRQDQKLPVCGSLHLELCPGTAKGKWAPWKRRSSARPWRIPSSRWKSCGPFIPSIPASPVASM